MISCHFFGIFGFFRLAGVLGLRFFLGFLDLALVVLSGINSPRRQRIGIWVSFRGRDSPLVSGSVSGLDRSGRTDSIRIDFPFCGIPQII